MNASVRPGNVYEAIYAQVPQTGGDQGLDHGSKHVRLVAVDAEAITSEVAGSWGKAMRRA